MHFKTVFMLSCFALSQCEHKDFVFPNNQRTAVSTNFNDNDEQLPKKLEPRYQVFEPGSYPVGVGGYRPQGGPIRPLSIDQRPGNFPIRPGQGSFFSSNRPSPGQGSFFSPNRPPPGQVPYFPPNRPRPPGRPDGSYYPGATGNGGTGILTGPVPSWINDSPIKDFNKCKCAQKFNCNSPGISYGHCDVGKQYCCYATAQGGQVGPNGVLVGPDGPIDTTLDPNYGLGQQYPRPGGGGLFGNQNGVLVGPGGPSAYPTGGGYGGQGVLVGPGGPGPDNWRSGSRQNRPPGS